MLLFNLTISIFVYDFYIIIIFYHCKSKYFKWNFTFNIYISAVFHFINNCVLLDKKACFYPKHLHANMQKNIQTLFISEWCTVILHVF